MKYSKKIASTVNIKVNGQTITEEPTPETVKATVDRLIIYKDKAGSTYQKIISYVPNANYLKKYKGDISQNSLKKIDADFDGYEIHKKWDGSILFIVKIKDGHAIRTYNLIATKKPSTLTTNTQVCETIEVYEWFVECEYEGDNPNPIWCGEPYKEKVGEYEDCHSDGTVDCDDPMYFGHPDCAPPDPDPDPDPTSEPLQDSCNTTKADAASKLNNTLNGNASIASAISSANAIASAPTPHEGIYTIEKNSGVYTATTPGVGSPHSGTVSVTSNTEIMAHSHTDGSFAVPSPWDAYTVGETNHNHSNVTTNLITSSTDDYAVVVTSPGTFTNFSNTFTKSDILSGADFNSLTVVGQAFLNAGQNAATEYYSSIGTTYSGATTAQKVIADRIGYETALTTFGRTAGLTILKKDPTTGDFKALHYVVTVRDGVEIYKVLICN